MPETAAFDSEIETLLQEMEIVAEITKKGIAENAASAQDQTEYNSKYNSLVERYEKAKERYDELRELRDERLSKRRTVGRFLASLSKQEQPLSEFDNCLWLTIVDHVTVRRDGRLAFTFVDGTEIEG